VFVEGVGPNETHLRDRGWGSPNSDEGKYTVVLYIYVYFVFLAQNNNWTTKEDTKFILLIDILSVGLVILMFFILVASIYSFSIELFSYPSKSSTCIKRLLLRPRIKHFSQNI
jgi:hypothetical protein